MSDIDAATTQYIILSDGSPASTANVDPYDDQLFDPNALDVLTFYRCQNEVVNYINYGNNRIRCYQNPNIINTNYQTISKCIKSITYNNNTSSTICKSLLYASINQTNISFVGSSSCRVYPFLFNISPVFEKSRCSENANILSSNVVQILLTNNNVMLWFSPSYVLPNTSVFPIMWQGGGEHTFIERPATDRDYPDISTPGLLSSRCSIYNNILLNLNSTIITRCFTGMSITYITQRSSYGNEISIPSINVPIIIYGRLNSQITIRPQIRTGLILTGRIGG